MGKISIVGLALATSQLATTDLPERSHQPGPDFIFPKPTFGKKSVVYVPTLLLPARTSEQGKVIGEGVHIYVCGTKNLNRTLAIDSPLQTCAVGLLVEFLSKLKGFSYLMRTLIYLSRMT